MTPASLSPTDFKAGCNRSHAMRRASDRFGLDFDDASFAEFESIVRAGASEACRPLKPDRLHEHRTLYAVKLGDKWYPVVFDAATDSVVTFPPEHALWPYYSILMPVAKPPAPLPKKTGVVSAPGNLSAVPANRLFDELPGFEALPEFPTVVELLAALVAVRARKQAIDGLFGSMEKTDWKRKGLIEESGRLAVVGRELKARRAALNIANHQRIAATKLDVPPVISGDPISFLMAALWAIQSMGKRMAWDITEDERAVQNAIQAFLVEHAEHHATATERPAPPIG